MYIDGFLSHLGTRSAQTLRAYRGDVERFLAFLHEVGLTVQEVSPEVVEDYKVYLNRKSRGGELLPASINRRLAVLSTYLDYLHVKTKGAVTNAVRDVRRPRVRNIEARAIQRPILRDLLKGITNPRDKAMLSLFIATGLRLEELRLLDKRSISQKRRTMPDGKVRVLGIGFVVGKGEKPRRFLVDERTLNLLVEYLKARGPDSNDALFISNRGLRMSRRNIQYVLERWCRRLGLPRTHIHALRHTFATEASNSGMSSLVLQELLGHSSLTVTRRYCSAKPERQAREYFAVQEFLHEIDKA